VFRSITNKIAFALMILLIISFCAISAVSYFTSEKKVVELVSQKEDQILKDVKGVIDTFFDENLEYVKKSSAVIDELQSGDEIMNFVLLEKKISNTFTFESAWWEIYDELKKDIEDPNLAKKKYYRYDIFYTIANQYVDEEKFYDALDKLGNDYTALSELSNTVVGRYEVPYFEDEVDLSKKEHMSGEFYVKTNEKEIIEVEEDKGPEYKNKMLNNALIGAGVAQGLLIPEVIRHTIKKKKEEEEYSKLNKR